MKKCRSFHFVQKRPKADRTYHIAKCLIGSCLLWGVFFSKIKDALLQAPGCHIPCSLCFLESQQHYHPNTSLWHMRLVPEGRVTRDVFVLLHVPRSPRWPRELGCVLQTQLPKHVWLPSASPNCWVRFPSPWGALLDGTEPMQHPAGGNRHNRHILTDDNSLSQGTEVLLRAHSPAVACACLRPRCQLRPWSSGWIARKDQKLEVEVSGVSLLGLLLTKGRRKSPNQNKPTKPRVCIILL